MAETVSPYGVLGIAPTLDPRVVKRAWFAALGQHPPHSDPDGFRRIRAAYEALTAPGGMAAAFVAAPLDLQAELARYRDRYDAALAAAKEEAMKAAIDAEGAARFLDALSTCSFAEALAAFG